MMSDFVVESVDALRDIYREPEGPPLEKVLFALDEHCKNFISHSPILMLGTDGDVSPRGDNPGFVAVEDDNTLIIPDRKGNFRLDSMQNIIRNPKVAILFMVPGMDVTLRIRGNAKITSDHKLLKSLEVNGKEPKTAIVVRVKEAFLHCGKALIRSDIWNPDNRVAKDVFPPPGHMYADHMKVNREEMEHLYDEHITEDLAEEGRSVSEDR